MPFCDLHYTSPVRYSVSFQLLFILTFIDILVATSLAAITAASICRMHIGIVSTLQKHCVSRCMQKRSPTATNNQSMCCSDFYIFHKQNGYSRLYDVNTLQDFWVNITSTKHRQTGSRPC